MSTRGAGVRPGARPILLLPPSEGKAAGGTGPARSPGAFPALERRRAELGAALAALDPVAMARVLAVGERARSAAVVANAQVADAPTLPALERFTGVLFAALDVGTLPAPARACAATDVLIIDGRWGLLRGDDPVPAYKLGITVSVPGLGPLTRWWAPEVSAALATAVAGRLVWDLLPAAHRSVWQPPPGRGPEAAAAAALVRRVRLERPGAGAAAGHLGKRAKGLVARHLLEHPEATEADLDDVARGEGLRAVVEPIR